MKSNIQKETIQIHVALATVFFLITAVLFFQATANAQDKALEIRDTQKSFNVSFEPAKSKFKVGEAIRFRIKGNRDFFLYLFSINKEENRAVLLIPGEKQKGNKYKGKRTHTVPNPDIEFYTDRPGTEQIVMVASTRYLNLKTDAFKKTGAFLTTTSDAAETHIKALRVREREDKKAKQQVVEEIKLNITGKTASVALAASGSEVQAPMVFISCDRLNYRLGDMVRVVYGADKDGWIHLYAVDPGGKRGLFKKQKVAADKVYHLKAQAESPAGDHALVAVFSSEAELKTKGFPEIGEASKTKALRLVEPEAQPPFAVYRIYILSK